MQSWCIEMGADSGEKPKRRHLCPWSFFLAEFFFMGFFFWRPCRTSLRSFQIFTRPQVRILLTNDKLINCNISMQGERIRPQRTEVMCSRKFDWIQSKWLNSVSVADIRYLFTRHLGTPRPNFSVIIDRTSDRASWRIFFLPTEFEHASRKCNNRKRSRFNTRTHAEVQQPFSPT